MSHNIEVILTMEDKAWEELIYDSEHDCWNSRLEVSSNNFVDISIEGEDTKTVVIEQLANLVFMKIKKII